MRLFELLRVFNLISHVLGLLLYSIMKQKFLLFKVTEKEEWH